MQDTYMDVSGRTTQEIKSSNYRDTGSTEVLFVFAKRENKPKEIFSAPSVVNYCLLMLYVLCG